VLHHAARKKWCEKPVIARPKEPKGRVRWVTYEEAEQLIAAAAPHLRPLVIFLLCTGARLSEALYLDWRDVDLSGGHVVFHDTKNGESRGVPLHPRAVAALANLSGTARARCSAGPAGKIKKTGRLWLPTRTARAPAAARSRPPGRACSSAPDLRLHPARLPPHLGDVALRENRDLTALMELGGWKSADMVLRYAHVNTSHLAGSIGRIWGLQGDDLLLREQRKR
jgi:integrase